MNCWLLVLVCIAKAEFRVDPNTTNQQSSPSVAAFGQGFVVVWQDAEDIGNANYNHSIAAVVYNASGAGDPFRIKECGMDGCYAPRVAALLDGFVVVWYSPASPTDYDIYARIYNASGAGDPEFRVNAATPGYQHTPIAATVADGFVVVWIGEQNNIYARRYNASAGLGAEFRVNSAPPSTPAVDGASVAAFASGFVVVWTTQGQVVGDVEIYGRICADAGPNASSAEFQVNVATTNYQVNPSVAAFADGFVVAWESHQYDPDVYARIYDAAGVAGAEFRVNNGTPGSPLAPYNQYPSVAALGDRFMVVWQTASQSTVDVSARVYNASEAGPEFTVNANTTAVQLQAKVSAFVDGFVVVWMSDQTGTWSVYGETYVSATSPFAPPLPAPATAPLPAPAPAPAPEPAPAPAPEPAPAPAPEPAPAPAPEPAPAPAPAAPAPAPEPAPAPAPEPAPAPAPVAVSVLAPDTPATNRGAAPRACIVF